MKNRISQKILWQTFWSLSPLIIVLSLILFLISWKEPMAKERKPAQNQRSLGFVDLHTHLFMEEGMSPMYFGRFNGPLASDSWKDRFSSQANPETLEASGAQIVVASLFSLHLLKPDMRRAIRAQIRLANEFVRTHPNWILAKSPAEARVGIAHGKKILILSLEGANEVLETEADIEEFVDRGGIRIVTPIHLMDDHIGGAAFAKGYHVLANDQPWFEQSLHPLYREGARANRNGLFRDGYSLIQALIAHHVWIDLAHASDQSQIDMMPLLLKAGQPPLYTHTVLRKYYGAERGLSQAQLERVRQNHGIVGIVPSTDFLDGTPADARFCPSGCSKKQCSEGLYAMASHYTEVASTLGNNSAVMVGTDFNGAIPHLPPSCGTGTSLDEFGLQNIGQTGEMWQALRNIGAPVPASFNTMVETFLTAWERIE